jgi:hypothetical protein
MTGTDGKSIQGKKVWYKRWWAITLFILIGLSILGNLGSKPSETSNLNAIPSQPARVESAPAPTQPTTPVVPSTYGMGDAIQAGDFRWKVTRMSTTDKIGTQVMDTFMGEKADGIFVILDVEVENTGKNAQYLTDTFVKLVDDQGREFSPNSVAAIYLKPQGSALTFETINPGIIKKGKIVYDIPNGLKVTSLRISSNLAQNSLYTVKLMT